MTEELKREHQLSKVNVYLKCQKDKPNACYVYLMCYIAMVLEGQTSVSICLIVGWLSVPTAEPPSSFYEFVLHEQV